MQDEIAKNATPLELDQRACPFAFEICLATIGVAFLSATTSVAALFYFYRKKELIMKKAISLIMAFVLCLGLCACGNQSSNNENSKFVGTYTSDDTVTVNRGTVISTKKTMTLRSDGTGYIEEVSSESFDSDPIGTVIKKYNVTWQCDEIYITIETTLTYHKYSAIDYFNVAIGESDSVTYELKGTQLFRPNQSFAQWDKKS